MELDNMTSEVKELLINKDMESFEDLVNNDKFKVLEHSNNFKVIQEQENKKIIKKLMKICLFCTVFMIIELIGGYIAGSLAIMTDAAHLLSDLSGFLISMFSLWVALKPANRDHTYGYHRAEVLGAMVSISIIWILTAWLIKEAVERLFDPKPINSTIMLSIALCGLLFNGIMAKVLVGDEEIPNMFEDPGHSSPKIFEMSENQTAINDNNENGQAPTSEDKEKAILPSPEDNPILRATFIHILGDMIQSLGVVLAALIIWYYQETHPLIVKVDPICTFVFGIIVLSTSIPVAKDCLKVLMEASPSNIDQESIINEFKNIDDIEDFHDIHIWCLSIGKVALTAHFISSNPQKTLETATEICRKYKIFHSTIQVEDYTQRRRGSFKLCTHINDNQIH